MRLRVPDLLELHSEAARAPWKSVRVLAACLSLGLQTAGIELAAHIEIDPEAAESYAVNFANGRDLKGPSALPREMEKVTAAEQGGRYRRNTMKVGKNWVSRRE